MPPVGSLRRFLRPDWRALLLLYVAAIWIRLAIWTGPIYGDEGFHYYISRHWGGPMENVLRLSGTEVIDATQLFWWRPAFMALLTPGALLGFHAYRLLFLCYTSLLPVFATLVLKDSGARAWLAYSAGLVFAFHPYFVLWGARVFPDALMATAFIAALWAAVRRRPWLSGACLLVAVWTKESAIVGAAAMGIMALLDALRRVDLRVHPLRIQPLVLAYGTVGILGLLPLGYALRLGLPFPGWARGGDVSVLFDRLFLTSWLIIPIAVGLLWSRSRRLALFALVYPSFFLYYRLALGRAVEIWYYALPSALAVLAAALALDEAIRRAPALGRYGLACVPTLAAVGLGALFVFYAMTPSSAAEKDVTMPTSRVADPSLPQVIRYEFERDREFHDALAHIRPDQWRSVFVIDIGWFFVLHPFATTADTVRWVYTSSVSETPDQLAAWVDALEGQSALTFLMKWEHPMNEAIRAAYADCFQHENSQFVLLDATGCSGFGDRLADEYRARWSPPAD